MERRTEKPETKKSQPKHRGRSLPHDEMTDEERLGHTASVEQQTFSPGGHQPDPNNLIGHASESPWANKMPGSKRRW